MKTHGSFESEATFDRNAEDYDNELMQGLAVSGESKEYFAERRIAWLAALLARQGIRPRIVMDVGCGTGTSIPHLQRYLEPERVIGVDVSERSLEISRARVGGPNVSFQKIDSFTDPNSVDLAYCNGLFHHVSPGERPEVLAHVHRLLRPDGLFAVWENNPWNPGTKYVMSRIPFDRDAQLVSPREMRRLMLAAPFQILTSSYLFIFPRLLRRLRMLEPPLARLPLGAQYLLLGRAVTSWRV